MNDTAAPSRQPLTRDRVTEAAIALADTEGLGAVSMRRVAGALGVEAMSLYNHVANKDALLAGMVDRVAAEIALPVAGGDWRAEMRRRSVSAHETMMRHRWAAMLFLSGVNTGPAMLRYVDATIGCLVAAGFPYPLADHAWNAIDAHVYGFTLQALNFPFAPEDYAAQAAAYLPQIDRAATPHLHRMAELVAAGAHTGRHDFGFGLDLILDGLARRLAAEGPIRT